MKITCDMGESFGHWNMGNDAVIMPHIDIACIACGFHAADPDTMAATVKLAIKHGVKIGAHPGYQDKQGFGRRSVKHTPTQIEHLISYQLGALISIAKHYGSTVNYVKLHGALYHDMLADDDIFNAVLNVIAYQNSQLTLIGQFSNKHQHIAEQRKINLYIEAYADRKYQEDGRLLPRDNPGAILTEPLHIIRQLDGLFENNSVKSINQKPLTIKSDVICIHGDNPASIIAIQQWRNR